MSFHCRKNYSDFLLSFFVVVFALDYSFVFAFVFCSFLQINNIFGFALCSQKEESNKICKDKDKVDHEKTKNKLDSYLNSDSLR